MRPVTVRVILLSSVYLYMNAVFLSFQLWDSKMADYMGMTWNTLEILIFSPKPAPSAAFPI